MSDSISIICPVFWRKRSFFSPKLVLQHLRHDHKKSSFQELMCKFGNCLKPITSFTSYRIHIQRYHKSEFISHFIADSVASTSFDTVNNAGTTEINANISSDQLDQCIRPTRNDENSNTENDKSNNSNIEAIHLENDDLNQLQQFKNQFLELYMECREKHMLPTLVLHSIIDKFVQLFATFEAGHPSCNCMRSNSITMCDVEVMWENLQKQSYYRAFCLSAGFVEPKAIQLNQDSYQYIPILSLLRHYLSHADVQNSNSPS